MARTRTRGGHGTTVQSTFVSSGEDISCSDWDCSLNPRRPELERCRCCESRLHGDCAVHGCGVFFDILHPTVFCACRDRTCSLIVSFIGPTSILRTFFTRVIQGAVKINFLAHLAGNAVLFSQKTKSVCRSLQGSSATAITRHNHGTSTVPPRRSRWQDTLPIHRSSHDTVHTLQRFPRLGYECAAGGY